MTLITKKSHSLLKRIMFLFHDKTHFDFEKNSLTKKYFKIISARKTCNVTMGT